MSENLFGEKWKTVVFDFEYTNDASFQVSNMGRVRSYNKMSDGNILKGSMINGYRIIRLKFFSPRDEKAAIKLQYMKEQIDKLSTKLRKQKADGKDEETIEATHALLLKIRADTSKRFAADVKERTRHYHALFHRLVAEYFLPKPGKNKTIVAHLDHDKLNNRVTNLKWMTPEENYEHQQKSPAVIKEKEDRKHRRKEDSKATKLTVTKVMLLKKMLNQGKPMKQLVKQFKVTDTQILRIKRGENWKEIEAAK